jgi:N-acetylglutamate synthase-like GNAT family acetyltransferase
MSETIRRATAADLPALDALMRSVSAYHGDYAPMLDGYAMTPEQVDRDMVFVAEADGPPLGFYSLVIEGEPELDLMFVADATQGSGLGARLFRHMAEQARALGLDAVKIVSNPPAEGFYRRMGADRVGTKRPKGRVTWTQPILYLRLDATSRP